MQDYKKYGDLLKHCNGLINLDRHWIDREGTKKVYVEYYLDGGFTVPADVYIEITGTSTKGTIGLLVDLEPTIYKADADEKLSTCIGTYILKVKGRDKLVRIKSTYIKFLNDFTGQTKYVRNVKKQDKKAKKKPINKYFQELQIGDWIFGISYKSLRVGKITRYTDHTVWASMSDDLTDKQKEFKMNSIADTYVIENQEQLEAHLTFATLKGWKGI